MPRRKIVKSKSNHRRNKKLSKKHRNSHEATRRKPSYSANRSKKLKPIDKNDKIYYNHIDHSHIILFY